MKKKTSKSALPLKNPQNVRETTGKGIKWATSGVTITGNWPSGTKNVIDDQGPGVMKKIRRMTYSGNRSRAHWAKDFWGPDGLAEWPTSDAFSWPPDARPPEHHVEGVWTGRWSLGDRRLVIRGQERGKVKRNIVIKVAGMMTGRQSGSRRRFMRPRTAPVGLIL